MTATLHRLLRDGHIEIGLQAQTQAAVMDALISGLSPAPGVLDPAQLAADVAAREARMSTGVGEGLALPHARTSAVSETVVALATLAAPVEWHALDGEPVDLVLLMVGPEAERSAHVHLLARVSRLLSASGVRPALAAAATPAAALAVVARAEERG